MKKQFIITSIFCVLFVGLLVAGLLFAKESIAISHATADEAARIQQIIFDAVGKPEEKEVKALMEAQFQAYLDSTSAKQTTFTVISIVSFIGAIAFFIFSIKGVFKIFKLRKEDKEEQK